MDDQGNDSRSVISGEYRINKLMESRWSIKRGGGGADLISGFSDGIEGKTRLRG